jgi:GAF domain-containing protein
MELHASLKALVCGVPHKTANLANASALIFNTLDDLNWAGFYLVENDSLVLNAFQGKPACIEIAIGKGVCGTAALEKRTLVVENVHEFSGHIACDGASNSEIVVPLFNSNGEVVGVLDIDSPIFSRFDENDKAGLDEFARIIESEVLKDF